MATVLEPYPSPDGARPPSAPPAPSDVAPVAGGPSLHPFVDRAVPRAQRVESLVRRTVAKVRRDGVGDTASAAVAKVRWRLRGRP